MLQGIKYKVPPITLILLCLWQPTDRLKSEDELAREEKERLEKLEMERLQRMHGFKEDRVPERQHRSADDLDDGFVFNMNEFAYLMVGFIVVAVYRCIVVPCIYNRR
jgi:hypothetical protein